MCLSFTQKYVNAYPTIFLRFDFFLVESHNDVEQLVILWNSIFSNLIRRFSRFLLLLFQAKGIRMNE